MSHLYRKYRKKLHDIYTSKSFTSSKDSGPLVQVSYTPNKELLFVINHVFMPPHLPGKSDFSERNEQALFDHVYEAAQEFSDTLPSKTRHLWLPIPKLLKRFSAYHTHLGLSEADMLESMSKMRVGEVLAFLVRAQNAGVVIRHDTNFAVFEAFELSPPAEAVFATRGRLLRSFPGPAVQIPIDVFKDSLFQAELSRFLGAMSKDPSESTHGAKDSEPSSPTPESSDPPHPRYITQLLTEILRGMGGAAVVPRITKRVADDVISTESGEPWRRSAAWLLLRVVIQTTLQRQDGGNQMFKAFVAFVHAKILHIGLQYDLPSYLLACMQRKTARRLQKIGPGSSSSQLKFAYGAVDKAGKVLNQRWDLANTAQTNSLGSTWAPRKLKIAADTRLTLYNGMDYLNQSLKTAPLPLSAHSFSPSHRPRFIGADNFAQPNFKELKEALFSEDNFIALADFETAVRDDLVHWASRNVSREGCVFVAARIREYSAAALKAYSPNPELLSIRVLTLFRQWVELDRMAVDLCPLLAEFSPEVPLNLFHHLLLRNKEWIDELDYIEKYLKSRYSKAVPGWSVFSDTADSTSFAVRYFDSDQRLQGLKENVETAAKEQKAKKFKEVAYLRTQYLYLKKSAEKEICRCQDTKNLDVFECEKCSLEEQASAMKMRVFEWPLPEDSSMAKLVIFELTPPLPFVIWREVTYRLLQDLDTSRDSVQQHGSLLLCNYPALGEYYVSDARFPRILGVLASSNNTETWDDLQSVSDATEKTVCVVHGHTWRLLDTTRAKWMTNQYHWDNTIRDHCTFRLPPGPYRALQYSVSSTSHTSNDIIANQSECPGELNFHEFTAFVGIRSGARLQWLNILSELRSGSLKFQEEAVYYLLKQTVCQIGPWATDGQREWHIEPTEMEFGKLLLAELAVLLDRMKAHWHNVDGILVITTLVSRLLASAKDDVVAQGCFEAMRQVRDVTYGWVKSILIKLKNVEDDARLQEYQKQLCKVAAACRSTYDVDQDKILDLLSSDDDVSVFLHCATLIHYNTPLSSSEADDGFRDLLRRDWQLTHRIEPLLGAKVVKQSEGLDMAVGHVWEFYKPSFKWKRLSSPNSRWVHTHTKSSPKQDVQYNLLSGQLLIEGRPIGQLPRDIVTHPTYSRIFGQKDLQVIPSGIGESGFKAANPIGADPDTGFSGYQVFFTLRRSKSGDPPKQLVIRTQNGEETLELIPPEIFENDLPEALIKDQTHWLNTSTSKGEIEVRDLKTRWISSPNNWRIRISSERYSATRISNDGGESLNLIDRRSKTMSMIAKQLQALEDPAQLMVTYSVASHRVSVSLPRFGLDFFLNDQVEPLLESANIPGMVVDKDQSSGTMIGFKNQLVLRQRDSPMSSLRQVIIPYASNAEFDISAFHHHHATMLSIGDQNMVRYFKYTIDPTLGRLEGDGSMLSRLYQVYLHAITSHCLPDPLTGQTGMEEALHQLSSAGMHSYQKLTGDERQMLYKLRNLTPIRTSYSHPSGHTMTILAQQENFHRLAISVLEHEDTVKMFAGISMDSHQADLGDFPRPSDQFQYRASCRNTFLSREQINGLGSRPSHQDDLPYVSRDGSEDTNQIDAAEVSNISTMVFNWEPKVDPRNQLLKVLGPCGMIPGVTEKVSLTYSHEWLNRKTLHFFLPACNACREASKAKNRYSIAFAFSAWTYTSQKIRPLIPIIFAFATVPELRALNPPSWPLYEPVEGVEPKEGKLSNIVMNCFMEPSRKHRGYEEVQWENDRRRASEVKELVTQLKQQWPCERPKVVMQASLFDIDRLNREAGKAFQTWFRNKHLFDYLQNVQYALNSLPKSTGLPLPYAFSPSTTKPQPTFDYVSFQQLFQERGAPTIPPPPTILRDSSWYKMESNAHNTQKLQDLIRQFRTSTYISDQSGPLVAIRQQYADDLEKSLNRLRMEHDTTIKHNALPTSRLQKVVQNYHRDCEKHLMVVHQNVWKSLSPLTESENALHAALLWPSLTIRSLLGALAFGGNVQLTGAWRKTLNSLARAVLAFQHACRLSKYMDDWKPEELHSELGSVIEKTEDDEQHSTRLLIQVDGNFLARPTQIDFTREMINPSSRSNSVFQLNMGEGKSSVILPMVAAALSDGKQLARVVVLKQLAPSMFHLLVQRLGGLANRRIFCMPFSRSLQLTDAQVQKIQHLHSMCVQTRGVLVMQPEHILSFKLLGLDRKFNASSSRLMPDKAISLSSPNSPALDVAKHLLDSQRWLDDTSRDILDESDEILHVRYQLVYTIGQRQSIHGSPDRWTIVQQILMLVKKHAAKVKEFFFDGLEVQDDLSGSYPFIRILKDEAAKRLVELVVRDVSNGGLEQCSFNLFPPELRPLILPYITKLNLTPEEIHMMEQYCRQSGFWNTILILRGLFAHGLLVFVLKERRWRVDYGLDPSRSMLAVPYRAKDVPSLRAEFSHPDVTILLTCLSYYWQGLSETQLEECFNLLLKKDDPMMVYNKWVLRSPLIPDQLKHLDAINIHDYDQRKELHQYLHHNQVVVDFFLAHVVFPRHAKEFPKKIAASGWDLAEEKHHVTTGFSGTNDGRYLLPTSIRQDDPLHQLATNARVLTYLLQPENDHYVCIQNSRSIFEKSILRLMGEQESKIQVLLDVGAQMLRFSNEEVASEWLNLRSYSDALAVIFFGPDDEPYVRTRNGFVEELVSSPFRHRLEKCLLYLDDAHTRGTDFKLPAGVRAAVTLGANVTKDKLLQGCMRMRKLGHGHSVMFFAPLEVDLRIRHATGLRKTDPIQVQHILLWTMQQSCKEVVHWIPRWAQQGVDYRKRRKAWEAFKEFPYSPNEDLGSAWIQDENWSLEAMYAPSHTLTAADHLRQFSDYQDILQRYKKWAPSSFSGARIEDEDEREVMLEIERERKIAWQPPKAIASTPHIHDDLRLLVGTGIFRPSSSAYRSLFQPLGHNTFETRVWSSPHLFATSEFLTTVEPKSLAEGIDANSYLRPVHWILSAVQSQETIFIVLSPDEVNALLPEIRRSRKVHLHLYSPKVTQSMKSIDDLAFYCIPPLRTSWDPPKLGITTRLNLWAGQLYLEDYRAYQYLCSFLGLYCWHPTDGDTIQPDGFIRPEHRRYPSINSCFFLESPVPYLKKLIALRRKGIDYFPTHLGQILHGRLLTEDDLPSRLTDVE